MARFLLLVVIFGGFLGFSGHRAWSGLKLGWTRSGQILSDFFFLMYDYQEAVSLNSVTHAYSKLKELFERNNDPGNTIAVPRHLKYQVSRGEQVAKILILTLR